MFLQQKVVIKMSSKRYTPLELMEKLVSFPTVSRDSNLPLVKWVEGYLADHDIIAHWHYDETGEKAALFAHVGPDIEGGIVLSGHTDVVPVANQKWKTNPFELHKQGKKYFGRGTADMKSFVAIVLSLVPKIISMNLKKPVHIMLSYDEEIGCVGIQKAVPFLKSMKKKPSYCIVAVSYTHLTLPTKRIV